MPTTRASLGAAKILICAGVRLYSSSSFKVQWQKKPQLHQKCSRWFGKCLEIVGDERCCDSSCVFIQCARVLGYVT